MSTFIEEDQRPILKPMDLVAWVAEGAKSQDNLRIGLEHEKILFHRQTYKAAAFDDNAGITGLLKFVAEHHDWEPAYEGNNIIGLSQNNASISLEPGGQLELSGAPLKTVHETCREVKSHLQQIKPFCDEHGLGLLSVGYNPRQSYKDVPWVPKSRYKILRDYLESQSGPAGPRMMALSTTVQVNLDYIHEADFVRKSKVAFACQPLVAALFANSPFKDGRLSGKQSMRNQIWLETDPEWTGIPAVAFEAGFGYERWIDYLLDRPCLFDRQANAYTAYRGGTFRDRMTEALRQGTPLTFSDWQTHLTTVFTDVRIKQFIELRAIDGQPHRGLCAMPAFWTGLLYDDTSLDQTDNMVKDWTLTELRELRDHLPTDGLGFNFRGRSGWDWVRDLCIIAESGLANRNQMLDNGLDERKYLDHLKNLIDKKQTLAEYWIDRFQGAWGRHIEPLYREAEYLTDESSINL